MLQIKLLQLVPRLHLLSPDFLQVLSVVFVGDALRHVPLLDSLGQNLMENK
jgi:hypothetical protein